MAFFFFYTNGNDVIHIINFIMNETQTANQESRFWNLHAHWLNGAS